MTTPTNELRAAVLRVADILEARTKQYAIYADGAPISAQVLVYAMLPGCPTNSFDWDLWADQFRRTRHDGTRSAVKALHDDLRHLLEVGLGGEVGLSGGGTYFTPAQVRLVADQFTVPVS
jgi:hypothetical protein